MLTSQARYGPPSRDPNRPPLLPSPAQAHQFSAPSPAPPLSPSHHHPLKSPASPPPPSPPPTRGRPVHPRPSDPLPAASPGLPNPLVLPPPTTARWHRARLPAALDGLGGRDAADPTAPGDGLRGATHVPNSAAAKCFDAKSCHKSRSLAKRPAQRKATSVVTQADLKLWPNVTGQPTTCQAECAILNEPRSADHDRGAWPSHLGPLHVATNTVPAQLQWTDNQRPGRPAAAGLHGNGWRPSSRSLRFPASPASHPATWGDSGPAADDCPAPGWTKHANSGANGPSARSARSARCPRCGRGTGGCCRSADHDGAGTSTSSSTAGLDRGSAPGEADHSSGQDDDAADQHSNRTKIHCCTLGTNSNAKPDGVVPRCDPAGGRPSSTRPQRSTGPTSAGCWSDLLVKLPVRAVGGSCVLRGKWSTGFYASSEPVCQPASGDLVHQLGDEDVGDSAFKHLGDNKQRRNLCDTTNSGSRWHDCEWPSPCFSKKEEIQKEKT